ncbi:putative transcription elongation factor spt5 like protein 1 [Quercus suber]|uniref:Transcription elongation factor spt5 like protein 1 n=1 Tax=Quercus suber TaxID=58331 RepID=A0AAW0J9K5_QUESU
MPNIVVNVRKLGEEESIVGIVQEVLMDGSCRIVLGDTGETMTALPDEMDVVAPRKNDKVKIMAVVQRGTTGKLIGVEGNDGIVKDHRTKKLRDPINEALSTAQLMTKPKPGNVAGVAWATIGQSSGVRFDGFAIDFW